MQHTPTTIEEQLIAKAIREECPWETLPKRPQSSLTSKEDWHKKIIEFCIKKRLPWNACFARKVVREIEYYEEMMRYLRRNLALFPYHLSEYVCRVMRISPFKYYCDIIFEVMKNEQPYDSIPNFSAADALRITGIGRNEFIDIMNKCRSKKFMWKINKSIAKELLPTQPVDFVIETWWIVCLVNFSVEEYKRLTEEETAMIDRVLKLESKQYMEFDPRIIKGLYRRSLIYFDVPVNPDDRFKVSRLEGFVSNREQSYEDPIEELLYAVFVVASENATVAELAATLQADLSQLQAAASFACRLGWAVKMFDPAYILRDDDNPSLSDEEENIPGPAIPSNDEKIIRTDFSSSNARVSFIVDANITSYLMMGSVSPGLKSHAVTLYEAGKLGHASIADLCRDLSTLEGARFEGELQEFANHATSLRCVLQCLLSGGVSSEAGEVENSDKVDTSLEHGDHQKSTVVEPDISIHSASDETEPNNNEAISIPSISADFLGDDNVVAGNGEASSCMAKNSAEPITGNVEENRVSGMIQNDIQDKRENATLGPDLQNDDKAVKVAGLEGGSKSAKRKRNYRVDVLRCESLATLAPATLERMFNREYGIILSMIPLPQNSLLPGPSGPVHLGPPCHAFMTPWMKLVLYSCARNGPLSVVLMKGQCLRLLPAPLAGCEKALVWSWDGSSVGGLGGKFEGTLVKGTVLLHCVNSLLKHSAVLVQPLSKDDLDNSGNAVTIDIPLPLKNSDGSVVQVGEELGLDIVESSKLNSTLRDLAYKIDLWTIGYIRLLKLYIERDTDHFAPDDCGAKGTYEWVPLSVEFGVPLFSPKLCNQICKRVISSQLLQTESFAQHYEAMHNIRKMLRDICSEYNWTGPSAKVLYQKGKTKGSSRNLMNYASGRWNPLVEPSSPICGASSDPQRRKLALRQHSRKEVLSFDGSILRSYALAPIFETATKPFDESLPGTSRNTAKADSDELDSKEVVFPGVNLLFDGSELHAFDICACLQARQLVSLVAEASAASSTYAVK